MRVLITGATGFVGAALAARLRVEGHEVVAVGRSEERTRARLAFAERVVAWDPMGGPLPPAALEGVDAVVHLAGETVVGRWTASKRRSIRESRVLGTRNLVAGLRAASERPRQLLSASAIGYYGDRGEEEVDENTGPGDDFLAEVGVAWEREALAAAELGMRVLRLRIGIVLARGGGALEAMLTPAKLGLGGPLGSGRQWWSWIHREDLLGLVLHALAHDADGVWNGTAPAPERQRDFARILGRVLGRPAFLPAPALALRLLLGGFSAELLGGKRVLPKAARAAGYDFAHPELEGALREILGRHNA